MTTLFVMTSMMQRSCDVDTNTGMQTMLPMLMMESDAKDDKLMMMLMMQLMSPNSDAVGLNSMLPFILLMDKDSSKMSNLLTMTMLSSSMGGMSHQNGYNTNFNMLLPFAMNDCER